MKTTHIILFFFLVNFVSQAQVKIGNNANTINSNSILELESTNKGFLPPRVALSNLTSPNPLSAPVPTGMIVYSSGGSVTNGAYMWNGSKWQNFSVDNSARSNYVLVKSAADLPTASGGVITLAAGTLYEINGTVSTANKINLNGCTMLGADPVNDKLVYTGTGELFTGSGTGGLKYLSLTAASGKVFNINAGNANKNMLVQNCYIVASNAVGTIEGVGGTVFFNNVAYFYNTNGIVLKDDYNVVMNNTLWDATNASTYEYFSGAFNIIQILGGDRLVNSGVIALDVSTVTSLNWGSVKVVMFVGSGTYVNGTFSNLWEVEASGINTEKDDVAAGNLYLTTSASTSFASINTPTKILGTTSTASLFRVSSTQSNRLTYTGTKTKRFQVICSLSSIAAGNNKNFTFYIYKNGVKLNESKQLMKCSSSVDRGSLTLSCTVALSSNDYIEVWAENNTDNTSLSVESLNLAIR